jgi:hypothetical protein
VEGGGKAYTRASLMLEKMGRLRGLAIFFSSSTSVSLSFSSISTWSCLIWNRNV